MEIESWVRILIVICCAILWRLGGYKHLIWRRLGIPLLLAAYFAFNSPWWVIFPIGLGYHIPMRLGYGMPDPMGHPPDEGSITGRFVVRLIGEGKTASALVRGLCTCAVAFLGSLIFITNPFLFLYWILAFSVAFLCDFAQAKDIIIEPLIGATIGLIVFFVR